MEHFSTELGVVIAAIIGALLVMTKIGRVLLPLLTLFFVGIVIACFYGMIIAPSGSGAGVLLFPAFFAALFAWIAGNLWVTSREHHKIKAMPEEEREAYSLAKIDSMIPELEEEIRVKSEKAQGFWISPKKRSDLKRDVGQAKFFLNGLRVARAHFEKKNSENN